MSSDEDEGDGRRVNRYESDDEGDVEGTFDEDAWNDSRTRNRGRTKEQAIYGIFGSDEDDDDDRTRGGRGAPVDYAAPMNFKSAGGGGAGLGAGETPTDMFAEHHDEHHRAPPTAGLGARGGIGSGAGLGSFAPQGGAGLGFGGFSKGSTITSTVENEETEARAPGLGSQGLGFGGGGAGLGFGGGGLGFAPASGGDGEDDGPAAGGLNPMDVDDNDSDDEDLLPSTFGQRYARSIARDGPRNQKLSPPLFADRHGRTDTPRAAEPWPLRSRILSCDNVNHACSRTSPATRQVQCAPTGYRAARHLFVGCSVCLIFCLSRLIRRP